MSYEERDKLTCGIEDFINKVNQRQDDEISCLVDCLVEGEDLEYSVQIISESCTIYKYYCEETSVAVQTHFTRSLQGRYNNMMNSKGTNTESGMPFKKITARCKRKPKLRPPVKPSSSYNPPSSTTVPNHPYARPPTKPPQTTYLVPARVEMFRKFEPRYQHPSPHHGVHYGMPPPCEFTIKSEYSRKPQSAYKAYTNGKTLIEVYSPTVGCGFNPRYNSLLIEPTIQSYPPLIPGQSRVNPPSDMQTFLHLAVEVQIPNSHDVRLHAN